MVWFLLNWNHQNIRNLIKVDTNHFLNWVSIIYETIIWETFCMIILKNLNIYNILYKNLPILHWYYILKCQILVIYFLQHSFATRDNIICFKFAINNDCNTLVFDKYVGNILYYVGLRVELLEESYIYLNINYTVHL